MVSFQSFVIYLVLAPPFESIEREGALERHSIISDKKDYNFVAYQVLIKFTRTRALQIMCLVLIFLNTIVKKHTLNPEITLLYQFHAQKGMRETALVKKFFHVWRNRKSNKETKKTKKD